MATGANSGTGSAVCVASAVASKPIRVDNWGNFLAQRIEALYDKQEHCDLTLRFPHGDLKAHSLVLHACTPFFTNLLKGKTTGPKILKMPPQISSSAMDIILKFVYTGRLEAPFSVDMLYSTAKLLKLQVLIRLLEAQMNSTEVSVSAGRPASPSRRGRPPYGLHRPRTAGSGYQPTNSQLAARRTSVVGTGPVRAADPPEDARPSRFELPDSDRLELRLPVLESGLLRPKSESRVESPPHAGTDREALFEHLRHTPVKRAAPPQENGAQKKRPKLEPTDTERDITVLREYYEEQRRRAQLLDEQGSGGAERVDDPAPDVDWQDQEAEPPPESTLRPEPSTPTTVATSCDQTPTTPRPILKQERTPAGASSGKKRVQFSESPQLTLTVHDMGDTSELVSQLLKQHPEVLRGGQNVKIRLVAQTGTGAPSHSEFVVMKQQSQQQQTVAAAAVTHRSATGGNTSETLDTPLSCSLCAQKGIQADFWWADQMAKHFQDEHGDASAIDLNTLSCTTCVRAGDPIDFVTVDDYFTHLRDVHDTRGVNSTGTCQLCGFSADKKLQLIYHQYIKHKIRPPRFITFPKCDRCDFEAISDSEMVQHRQRRHKMGKEYKCKDCGSIFLNLSLLEGHMRTNACRQGSDEKRKLEWKCDFCGMSFSRSYNLKGHMRSVHKMSVERRRVSQLPSQPVAAVKQEVATTVPALSVALDPSSEAENLSTVANSVAASLSLAVDGEYMALPDGIVPVEDENGVISYIALRPAEGDGGGAAAAAAEAEAVTAAAHSDDTVLEVTRYTMPVVVSSGTDSVTIQVAPAACAGGPGASDGETVLPDLAIPSRNDRTIDLPPTTRPDIARTLIPVPQLQTAGQVGSRSGTPRGERRSTVASSPSSGSSRISVSSSEVTVSDLAEPGSILPHLPGESIPAAASPQPYGQAISLAQLQHGQIVMAGGMAAGHVIVSELPSGQEVIVANVAPGRLYELQQSTSHDQLDVPGPQQPAETAPERPKADLSQSREAGLSQAQHTGESVLSQNRLQSVTDSPSETRGGVIAAASQQGTDIAQDAHHTQEVLVANISHSNEFIGPSRLPVDPDIADVQPDKETHSLVTVEHDASESGPPAADEVDASGQLHDQHSGASGGAIDAHGLQSVVVTHYQPAGLSSHQIEQAVPERNVSKCSSGGVTVAPESQLSQAEGESAACQPAGGDGATVAGEIPVTVAGEVEIRSPEGRPDLVDPQEESVAVTVGDESQLVLVLDEEKVQAGAVEVQDVAAVETEELVTEQPWSDSPVRADTHSRLSVTAADADGAWEALPSADDSALRHHAL